MSKLKELERLADAAAPGPWIKFNGTGSWALRSVSPSQSLAINFHERDVDFIAAANPATIKAMCALLVQMREVLNGCIGFVGNYPEGFASDTARTKGLEALAAFDDFDEDKLNEN